MPGYASVSSESGSRRQSRQQMPAFARRAEQYQNEEFLLIYGKINVEVNKHYNPTLTRKQSCYSFFHINGGGMAYLQPQLRKFSNCFPLKKCAFGNAEAQYRSLQKYTCKLRIPVLLPPPPWHLMSCGVDSLINQIVLKLSHVAL